MKMMLVASVVRLARSANGSYRYHVAPSRRGNTTIGCFYWGIAHCGLSYYDLLEKNGWDGARHFSNSEGQSRTRKDRFAEWVQLYDGEKIPPLKLCTTIIASLTRKSKLEKANQVVNQYLRFKDAPRDEFFYTAAIRACGKNESKACWLLQDMKEKEVCPTAAVYKSLFEVIGNTKNVKKAVEILDEVLTTSDNIALNTEVFTSALSVCAKAKDTAQARKLFGNLGNRNICPTKETLAMYLQVFVGEWEQCLKVFHKFMALDEGFVPSARMVNIVLNSLAEAGKYQQALDLFDRAATQWQIVPDKVALRTVAKACGRAGATTAATAFLARAARGDWGPAAPRPDTQMFNSVLEACARAGDVGRAWEVREEMRAAGVQLTPVSYDILIKTHARLGDWVAARDFFEEAASVAARGGGSPPPPRLYATLMAAYAHAGLLNEIEGLFSDLVQSGQQPNLFIFSTMIKAFSGHLHTEKAVEYLEMMRKSNHRPTVDIYNEVILSCVKQKQTEKAVVVMNYMNDDRVKKNSNTVKLMRKINISTQHML